ncbi:cupin domain-containing protein [Actinomadura sp. 9N407]|uniref:cupin domain-containing protein n=1 Tax=Actinomadura sp. 9N407 TaxID=3375154 RepID=UPI0037AC22FE
MPTYYRAADDETWTPYRAGAMGYLRQDEALNAGVWAVTPAEAPAQVEVTLPVDRTVLVLDGMLEIAVVDGATYSLGVGDSASFPKGTTIRISVLAPLRQFFVDRL